MNFNLILKCAGIFFRSAGLLDVLQGIGVAPEIIEAVQTLPPEKQQHWVAALRKNPALSLAELKVLPGKEKKIHESATDDYEKRFVDGSQKFNSWALIQLKKLRHRKELPTGFLRSIWAGDYPEEPNAIAAWLQQNNRSIDLADYVYFLVKLDEIGDWNNAVDPQLASLTAQQAIEASDLWHQERAKDGSDQVYQEGESGIVYGPTWQNPAWQGWTIRKVKTQNDLQVEGNLMNHCVGSYCDRVEAGNTDIYSLRDPSNQPHVTMETSGGSFKFEQIQGKSNSDPKPEYKAMVKEWISGLPGAVSSEFKINLYDIENVNNPIEYIKDQMTSDYGFKDQDSNIMYIFDTVTELFGNDSEKLYKNIQNVDKFAKLILDHAIDFDSDLNKKLAPKKERPIFIKNSALYDLHNKYHRFYDPQYIKEHILNIISQNHTRHGVSGMDITSEEAKSYLFTAIVQEAKQSADLKNLLNQIWDWIPQFPELIPLFSS